MDPITTAAVAGVLTVAADAAKEGATHVAKAAWGKIKNALGGKEDPAPADIKTRAEKTLAEQPQLAAQVQRVCDDYSQQVGRVSVGSITAKTSIVGEKNTFQGDVTFN